MLWLHEERRRVATPPTTTTPQPQPQPQPNGSRSLRWSSRRRQDRITPNARAAAEPEAACLPAIRATSAAKAATGARTLTLAHLHLPRLHFTHLSSSSSLSPLFPPADRFIHPSICCRCLWFCDSLQLRLSSCRLYRVRPLALSARLTSHLVVVVVVSRGFRFRCSQREAAESSRSSFSHFCCHLISSHLRFCGCGCCANGH